MLHLLILLALVVPVRAPLPNRVERASNPTLTTFFQRVTRLVRAFERFAEHHDLGHPRTLSHSALQTLEEMWETLQTVLNHFTRIQSEVPPQLHQPVENSLQNILQHLQSVHQVIQTNSSASGSNTDKSIRGCCQRVSDGSRGASRYNIQQEQLEMLLSLRMTISEIARSGILGTTCRSTIYGHCRRLKVQLPRARYSSISDERLQQVVQEVHQEQPNSGSEEIRVTLAATRGVVVQRQRVRSAISEADPLGCASRWAQTTQRRTYCVASPNSLWHLDNNHALRRWGFYVHGAIDGFSRMIPFLCVAISNTAKIALICFIKGIRHRGLPSRIRLDKGSEYNGCEQFMEWQRGPNRGSALRGKSVHNQRIERLWRDVFTKVLEKFYNLFYHMEDTEALDLTNSLHRFALQYTYLPRIQAALSNWAHVHNNHGIRTEKHKTPEQMWFTNMIQQRCALQAQESGPSRAVMDVDNFNIDNLRVDILNRFDINLADTHADVVGNWLLTCSFLSEEDLADLRRQIDPLRHSNVQGIDIYGDVVNYVIECMERHQSDVPDEQGS